MINALLLTEVIRDRESYKRLWVEDIDKKYKDIINISKYEPLVMNLIVTIDDAEMKKEVTIVFNEKYIMENTGELGVEYDVDQNSVMNLHGLIFLKDEASREVARPVMMHYDPRRFVSRDGYKSYVDIR